MLFRSDLFAHCLFAFSLLPTLPPADTAAFDLPGPRVEVRVKRGGKELPIAEVPNLQGAIVCGFIPICRSRRARIICMIVTFLRGSTNPPPEDWFTRIETWNKHVRQEGVMVTVPEGAEQVLMFLAPATGGDYSTLRSNVRGKPGAFVRASQDLDRAALDRSRLDAYLNP